MEKIRYYLKLLGLPLAVFVAFFTLNLLWKVFNIPPAEELAILVKDWYGLYGLPILFLSSIVEGALVVGNYFPGVFVIFLGVILADSASQAVIAVVVLSIGLLIAHVLNYVLGRYGWYKLLVKFGMGRAVKSAEEKLSRRGPLAILASYWMPNLGALTDTAAGIIHLPFKTFILYSILSTAFWNTIVGTTVYFVGDAALKVAAPNQTRSIVFYLLLALWIVLLLVSDYLNKNTKKEDGQVDNKVT